MIAPEPIRFEVSGGVSLHVLQWTPPDPVEPRFLLVHGLASNARLWDGVSAELAERAHPVAAVDQRGHGLSDKPTDGYDFETVTADLALVIEALGGPPPIVAGQSWGGNVVVDLAARRPDLVRGVVCVDGGWIDLSRFPSWEECERALAPPQTVGLAAVEVEAMLRGRHPDWPEFGIAGALACFEVRDDGTVAPWLTYERHLRILRSLWEQRISEVLAQVKVPVLLLPCDDGSEWTARKREEVEVAERCLRRVRTHWFNADHDVHAQHPAQVADVVTAALDDGFFG